jgi:uroporphyrinogen III methyltransferase / synthase
MTALAGTIYLVGAGPGDPGLITRRGHDLIEAADVVVFDRLASPHLLALTRPDALLIDAGKTAGRHTMSQDQINAELVRHARAGLIVVRLKGGDPFIFGRGYEELDAARAAGVPCEVVPGVTSAVAVPAAAGIPVTCRGLARTFAVATPQTGTGNPLTPRDYAALAEIDTVSFLMPLSELRRVADGLIAAGRDHATPAAVIEHGTTLRQRHTLSTLATIADDAAHAQSPAVLVVGDVAALAARSPLNAPHGPLAGRSILVTRPPTASGDLIRRLRALGARVIDAPLIDIRHTLPADDHWTREPWDWVVFCSLHGVRGFWNALRAAGLDARWLARARLAAVGPKTAAELRRVGLHADLVPDEHRAAALARALEPIPAGSRVLFPCGTLARDELPDALTRAGHTAHRLLVYETHPQPLTAETRTEIDAGLDALLLYSPSAARSLKGAAPLAGDPLVVCVGPTTAHAAREVGFTNLAVPDLYGDDGVLAELSHRLSPRNAHAPA